MEATNSWKVMLRDQVWEEMGVHDVTAELLGALWPLSAGLSPVRLWVLQTQEGERHHAKGYP